MNKILAFLLWILLVAVPPALAINVGDCPTAADACYDNMLANPSFGSGLITVQIPNNTNAITIAGGAATLYSVKAFNNSTTIGYLKIYNAASGVTCGSGTPTDRAVIPANSNGAGYIVNAPLGENYSSGIIVCATGGFSDTDTTALAANTYSLGIQVQSTVVTASLSASPTSILPGGSSTLTWSSSNATSCVGSGFSTGGATSGTDSVSPSTTTTYSVTCSGASGSAMASATVTVSTSQSIASVSLSNNQFAAGSASGTTIGTISVVMSPTLPAFSGTLSLSGADALDFQLSGSTLETSGVLCSSSPSPCYYTISIVATSAGATNSPFSQPETIVAFNGYVVATTGSDSNPGTLASPFATLGKCQTAMQGSGINRICYIRAGSYSPTASTYFGQTYSLYLTSADNGETWSYYPPDGYGSAVIDGGSSSPTTGTQAGIQVDGASNVTINGLQLQNYAYFCIVVHGGQEEYVPAPTSVGVAANDTVKNNICHGVYAVNADACCGESGIIGFINVPNMTISNNVVYSIANDGIRLMTGNQGSGGNMTGGTISNNAVYSVNTRGGDDGCIYMQDEDHGTIYPNNVSIVDNYARDCGASAGIGKGIYLDDGVTNATVTSNIVTGIFGWGVFYHEGCCDAVSGNAIDLGSSGSQAIIAQQMSNTSQGDMHDDTFEGNIVISGGGGGGFVVGCCYTLPNLVTIQNNAYWYYAGSAISTTCAGDTMYGCPQDASPVTDQNPDFTACYAMGNATLAGSPVNFPALPTSWGYPGYTIPATGTRPSYPSPTC